MKQMSSTILRVYGSSSQTHMPDLPCWPNLNFDGAIGNRLWPEVMVVSRWPLRMESGRSLSIPVLHLRLVVVQVHLRRPADHVQIDDVLGLRRRNAAGRRPSGCRLGGRASAIMLAAERGDRPSRGLRGRRTGAGSRVAYGLICRKSMRSLVQDFVQVQHLVGQHRPGRESAAGSVSDRASTRRRTISLARRPGCDS